jgi:DNA adenine methylase
LRLLEALKQCRGKVLLSGYHATLYDDLLKDWACHEFELPNHAAGGTAKRRMVECVWANFR